MMLQIIFFSILGIGVSGANGNQCEEILVPMCRGLVGYTHTKLPNQYGHTSQREVYRAIESYWQFMDSGCSDNLRLTFCGLYLPNCTETSNAVIVERPCKQTCHRARRLCKRTFKRKGVDYPKRDLRCRGLRRERDGGCIRSATRPRRSNSDSRTLNSESGICQPNMLSLCHNLTFNLGSLPNHFNQSNVTRIQTEMSFYQPLIDSNCHPDFRFFLCGTYRPFCIQSNPWTLPCRELCEEIKQSCMSRYNETFGGLPWSQKFQCHRYAVSTESSDRISCVVPADDVLALGAQ